MGIYKFFGAALLVVSAWVASRALGDRPRARVAQTEGFLQLFRALRHGIAYDRAPIKEILARLEPEVARACSGTGEAVTGEDLAAFIASCTFLSDDLAQLMARAADELERGYREEQIAVCDRYAGVLETVCREDSERVRERTALLGRLFPVLAVGAVILLL